MTLVEVMVAITILTTVVWGAVAFATSGRTRVELANQERVAAQIALEQLERARGAGYDALDYDYGVVTINNTPYTWSLYAQEALADPGDADSTFKQVEVAVYWPVAGGQTFAMNTAIAP
jgi:type II secretory pathway pseudopilin PulG